MERRALLLAGLLMASGRSTLLLGCGRHIVVRARGGLPSCCSSSAASRAHVGLGKGVQRSFAGLPELTPDWVAEHRDALTMLDVRSTEEFNGPDGRVPESLLIPLPELEQRLNEITPERPVVVLCHSGSRSALATQQLQKAGFSQVANLRGGLRRWSDEGYPLEGESPR